MALLENSRSDIAEFNGLSLLIDFLNERPYAYLDNSMNYLNNSASKNNSSNNDAVESEISACERVQQKAAIAISRFCKEAKYTSQLVELGGALFKCIIFFLSFSLYNSISFVS